MRLGRSMASSVKLVSCDKEKITMLIVRAPVSESDTAGLRMSWSATNEETPVRLPLVGDEEHEASIDHRFGEHD